jgi:hypothetical protein
MRRLAEVAGEVFVGRPGPAHHSLVGCIREPRVLLERTIPAIADGRREVLRGMLELLEIAAGIATSSCLRLRGDFQPIAVAPRIRGERSDTHVGTFTYLPSRRRA